MKIGVRHMPTPAAMPINSLGDLVRLEDILKGGQHMPSNDERAIPRGNGHQQSTECSERSTDTKRATPPTTIHDHIRPSAANQTSNREDRGESGELGISHGDAIWEPEGGIIVGGRFAG
jgi:hypothetical protein